MRPVNNGALICMCRLRRSTSVAQESDSDYLLRSPRNAKRLLAALARSKAGVDVPQSIPELKAEVGLDDKEDVSANNDLPSVGSDLSP